MLRHWPGAPDQRLALAAHTDGARPLLPSSCGEVGKLTQAVDELPVGWVRRAYDNRATPNAKYCTRQCKAADRSIWRIDNPLKRRFVDRLNQRGISAQQAARESGIPYATVKTWLQTANSRLDDSHVLAIARWLDVAPEDAIAMQGGTVYERKVKHIEDKMRTSPKFIAHHKRRRKSKKFARESVAPKKENEDRRKVPFSADHKAAISKRVSNYRQSPRAHALVSPLRDAITSDDMVRRCEHAREHVPTAAASDC